MLETKAPPKTYCGIDLFKLIAAVSVVLLHAVETTSRVPDEIKFVFTRYAVPFFFITSGFFFFNGISNAKDKKQYFVKYEKNILKIFFVWAIIIYSPFEVLSYIQKYPDAGVLKIVLFLFRRIFVIGPGPYWYLVALMWSAVFLYICFVEKKEWLIRLSVIVGLLLEICYSCFNGFLSEYAFFEGFFKAVYFVFSWEFNFFMFGIPFMGMGFLIAKNKWEMSKTAAIIVLIVSTALRFAEYNLPQLMPSRFWDNNCISVCFIIQALAYFMLAKSVEIKISRKTSLILRQLSSCIYFSHAIFLYEILNPLLNRFTSLPVYSGIMILPKIIIVILMCSLLFVTVKKINNKYLNILING